MTTPKGGKKYVEEPTMEPVEESTTTVVDEEVIEAKDVIIVPKGSTAVTTLADVQELVLADAEEDLGFEKGDVALPFMRILQSNSPQVKRQNAKYVDGAEAGMFYNAATNGVYNGMDGIDVIVIHYTKQATLWIPRTPTEGVQGPSGGGFVREVPMPEAEKLVTLCTKNDKKKDITPAGYRGPNDTDNGNMELTIAALYYLFIVDLKNGDGSYEAVAYPLSSTQMKKSRQWNALIQNSRLPHPSGTGSFRSPFFGYTYHLSTVPESNALGDWMGLKIKQGLPLIKYDGAVPKEMFPGAAQLYLAARDFRAMVAQGKVKTKAEDLRDDDGGTMASGDGDGEDDEKLPF